MPEHEVSWVFARDLVSRGLRGPAGEGDVRIRPGGLRGVRVMLTSTARWAAC